uniref:Uncharacterized protein n=1 Tax=Rhizophora mucronata TaxID=61149 RepID=A0A2P2PAH9_RHIMU
MELHFRKEQEPFHHALKKIL